MKAKRIYFIVFVSILFNVTRKVTLAQITTSIINYPSTVSSDSNGPLNLNAEINYDINRNNSPITVVMHGYSPASGNLDNVRANARRLCQAGFFVISPAMRGRDGSGGIRDSGGLEIYDIYDAVEFVKSNFAKYIDPTNISITGYSGGGGNVMSALTKFPDYFRLGSSYFGMSDYGYDTTNGWYFLGAGSKHRRQMRTDIGDPAAGDPNITDRYAARASNLASQNNPYSEIHLYVNHNESTCPQINSTSYRDNAVAHADYSGEFKNINVHIGQPGVYQDFNKNGVNDSNELQHFPHGFPTADQQHAAENWYLDRLLQGTIPQPVLRACDELYIAGYAKTKLFSLWLGDGQNAAARLRYTLSPRQKIFTLRITTSNKAVNSTLTINTADMAGKIIKVSINSLQTDKFLGGGIYTLKNFCNNDTVKLETFTPN